MECINNILNNEVFWHFVTVVTSFIIVEITLSSERKNNRESIEIQEKQQKEQQQIDERLHNESLQVEKERLCQVFCVNIFYFLLRVTVIKLHPVFGQHSVCLQTTAVFRRMPGKSHVAFALHRNGSNRCNNNIQSVRGNLHWGTAL